MTKRMTTGLLPTRMLSKSTEMHIDEIIARITREGGGVVSVACLDIDKFSAVEDERGFEAADGLLKHLHAAMVRMQNANPAVTWASRYVRDSFLVVMDNLPIEDAFMETETIRRTFSAQEWPVSGPYGTTVKIKVTFSAGVATYPGDPESRATLIGFAEDAALRAYRIKGGNTTQIARPEKMEMKSNYYFPTQLNRLKAISARLGRTEAALLREALDDVLRKYDQREVRRRGVYEDQ